MNPIWGHMVGVLIVVMMLVFIGIWYWAWRPRHAETFEALAELPMLEGQERMPPDETACDETGRDETARDGREGP